MKHIKLLGRIQKFELAQKIFEILQRAKIACDTPMGKFQTIQRQFLKLLISTLHWSFLRIDQSIRALHLHKLKNPEVTRIIMKMYQISLQNHLRL